jgi:hypothetical protein
MAGQPHSSTTAQQQITTLSACVPAVLFLHMTLGISTA